MFSVAEIMNESVYLVHGTHPVIKAVQEMVRLNVGMMVVVREGKVDGLVTERDIVRRVVLEGLDPITTEVQSVMTEALMILESASLSEACRLMLDKRVRYLPVVDSKGQPLGVLGMTDLLTFFGNRAEIADLYNY